MNPGTETKGRAVWIGINGRLNIASRRDRHRTQRTGDTRLWAIDNDAGAICRTANRRGTESPPEDIPREVNDESLQDIGS